jgi:hypothetical protein
MQMESTQDTKTCRNCNEDLPITKFKFRSGTGRQAGQRNSMCNRCLYVRYTRPNLEKKMAEIHQYQLERGCADCGYNAHPAALEFDHRPGTEKLFNVGEKIGAKDKQLIWDEIAKCDVVCANCHAIRTYNRRVPVEVPLDALPLGRIPNAVKRR